MLIFMTSFSFNTAMSLDGFIADSDNSLAWLFEVDSEDAPDNKAFMDRVGVLVEGSTTYEWVLKEANLLAEPHKWQEYYGDRPTYVFTTRVLPVPQGADVRFVRGDVSNAIPEIVSAAFGKDVWIVGGGDLAGQFADARSLDFIQLSVAPATLGAGAPLLPRRIGPQRLELVDAHQQGKFAQLTYRVRHA